MNNKQSGIAEDATGSLQLLSVTSSIPILRNAVLDTLQMVRFSDPVPPRVLQPKIPIDLQTICLKCLEKDPSKRYASTAALADDPIVVKLPRHLE